MAKNLKQKGNEYFKQGQYHLAINMYKKYVAKPHDDNKNAYYNMGLCMFKVEKYQECIKACKEAIKIDQNYLKAYYRLALASQKIQNQYKTLFYARQFCERSKDDQQSIDLKQMKALSKKYQQIIMYPSPTPIEQKLKIFYMQQDNKNGKKPKKEGLDNPEYFKGYNWIDVQKCIDQGKMTEALNKAYGICRNQQSKNRQINEQNLKILKKIKSGALPSDTKIVTDVTYLQKQIKKDNLKQLKSIEGSKEISVREGEKKQKQKQKINEDGKGESLEQQYKKYFLNSLQKKVDIFEGFPSVLMSIISNKQIKLERIEQILSKIKAQYGMFEVLRMSMSQNQKRDLKKGMDMLRINQKLIQSYCS